MLAAEPNVEVMLGQAPGRLLATIVRLGVRPVTIAVRTWRLENVLSPVASAIGVKLV